MHKRKRCCPNRKRLRPKCLSGTPQMELDLYVLVEPIIQWKEVLLLLQQYYCIYCRIQKCFKNVSNAIFRFYVEQKIEIPESCQLAENPCMTDPSSFIAKVQPRITLSTTHEFFAKRQNVLDFSNWSFPHCTAFRALSLLAVCGMMSLSGVLCNG